MAPSCMLLVNKKIKYWTRHYNKDTVSSTCNELAGEGVVVVDTNNTIGVDKLAGPLHNSLCNHFMKYYTLSENKDTPEQEQAERRLKYIGRLADRQEES